MRSILERVGYFQFKLNIGPRWTTFKLIQHLLGQTHSKPNSIKIHVVVSDANHMGGWTERWAQSPIICSFLHVMQKTQKSPKISAQMLW
jgi:hypothetical protein